MVLYMYLVENHFLSKITKFETCSLQIVWIFYINEVNVNIGVKRHTNYKYCALHPQ